MKQEEIKRADALSRQIGDIMIGHSIVEIETALALVMTFLENNTPFSLNGVERTMEIVKKNMYENGVTGSVVMSSAVSSNKVDGNN